MGRVTTTEAIKELRRIKKGIGKTRRIEKMMLFGSRARGDELLTSDVDVIVVSGDYDKMDYRKRPDQFLDEWTLPVDLEILCYSPQEFESKRKEIGIVRQAAKEGIII